MNSLVSYIDFNPSFFSFCTQINCAIRKHDVRYTLSFSCTWGVNKVIPLKSPFWASPINSYANLYSSPKESISNVFLSDIILRLDSCLSGKCLKFILWKMPASKSSAVSFCVKTIVNGIIFLPIVSLYFLASFLSHPSFLSLSVSSLMSSGILRKSYHHSSSSSKGSNL